MIRILIADDQKLVRDGLRALLANSYDIEVIGEAHDGVQAVALAGTLAPDIVLLDIRMPRLDGLAAAHQIVALQCGTRVLMVAMQYDDGSVQQAVHNGAAGFVTKTDMYTELIPAIRAVCAGKEYMSASLGSIAHT